MIRDEVVIVDVEALGGTGSGIGGGGDYKATQIKSWVRQFLADPTFLPFDRRTRHAPCVMDDKKLSEELETHLLDLELEHVTTLLFSVRSKCQREYLSNFVFKSFDRAFGCLASPMEGHQTTLSSNVYLREFICGVMVVNDVESIDRLIAHEWPENPLTATINMASGSGKV